jgi:hypothetical protein
MTPEVVRSWWKFFADPSHQMWVGLAVAVLFSGLALVGLIRLHFTSRTILPLDSSGAGASQISNQGTPWSDNARLTLVFDSATPSVIRQEGVRCYHWHSVSSVGVDWSTQKTSTPPGYMLIFLEFIEPTHTDNWLVRADGKSSEEARVMTTSATGATVRVVGDTQGKTIDIRFSKDRILDP